MNKNSILASTAIVFVLLSGCEKKPAEIVGDLYVDYQANFGKSAADILINKDEFQIIDKRLKLIDIKKIATSNSIITIETFTDFQYRCSKQKNYSDPEIICEEYQITYEPEVKQVPTGQKLALLLDRTQDPPTLAVPTTSSIKSFKLTRNEKQPDYKIIDAKIVGLPQTGEELLSTMWFSVDLNGKSFYLSCSAEICTKLRDDLLKEASGDSSVGNESKTKKPETLSGTLRIQSDSAEDGSDSLTKIFIENVELKY